MSSRPARLNVKIFIFKRLFSSWVWKSKTFTYCTLVDSSTDICWTSPFVILGMPDLFCRFYSNFDGKSY